MAWLMVVLAGSLEMVWSYSSKKSNGFEHLGWGVAGELLPAGVRDEAAAMGTAYAVWTGIGAAGSFMVGIWLLGESTNPWRVASALMIVAGVMELRLAGSGQK